MTTKKTESAFVDLYLHNARIATMQPGGAAYGLVRDGAMAIRDGRIAWLGARADAPEFAKHAAKAVDCQGLLLTPGLIDCHTHLVYAGDRAGEFEQRLSGVSYADIALAGGGILSTVRATRAASEAELVAQSLPRVDDLLAEGVTALEIKSGYGLETATEARMLSAAREIGNRRAVRVVTTFLGAHALPEEFAGRADDYIERVADHMLPAIAEQGLADAVDGFCETIGFSLAQMERVFSAARRAGLPVKLHAEQLSLMRGAALAARYQAQSADHLEYLDQAGIDAMANAGSVAVLLPGAFYFLRETRRPPVAALRAAGVPIAIASDANPGSSPVHSLLLMLNMACTLFELTPEEALAGVTRNAARALGRAGDIGALAVGMSADVAFFDVPEPATLAYRIGANPCRGVLFAGRPRDLRLGGL